MLQANGGPLVLHAHLDGEDDPIRQNYLATAVNTGRTLMVGLRNLNEVDATQSELRHRLATERRAMERLLFSPHRNVVLSLESAASVRAKFIRPD